LWKRAQDRVHRLEDNETQIVLNRVADLSSAVFGEMCLVQSAGLQALLELKASEVQLSNITVAEIFGLEERRAPTGSQFIKGMLYWLAIGDHVLSVKTNSMSQEHFRTYAAWLLKQQSRSLPLEAEIALQAEFDRSQVACDIGEIKAVKVSGRAGFLEVRPADPTAKERSVSRRVADKVVAFAQAIPVTEALLGAARTDSLVKSLGPQEYLAVDASVRVRGKRTEESRQEMGRIANELADMTDGKVQVEGKDGKLSDDDAILRTRMPFSLAQEGSNFLEFDNVADQLQEVYSRFVRDGKIPA
jgi:hypothetical protein